MTADVVLKVDRKKRLGDQTEAGVAAGHNRWHPAIKPRAHVEPGQVVQIETIDALDGQVLPHHTAADEAKVIAERVHPLTGPIFVKGAAPGDLLEVTILDIVPEPSGWTSHNAVYGFLRKEPPDSALLVHWNIAGGYATSKQLPGIRIPACMHVGVMGLAPSLELLREVNERERRWKSEGGTVNLPTEKGAVPADPAISREAWRTIPPHETGGNLDIKQLGKGARVLFPVYVDGALFSLGDVHFAQGDGEVCGTAIEIAATVYVKFTVIKNGASNGQIRDLMFYGTETTASRDYVATTGQSHHATGESKTDDLNAAARNAINNMIAYLMRERALTRQQAYILCSVAMDLKISQVVDNPNYLVTATLPLDIFT